MCGNISTPAHTVVMHSMSASVDWLARADGKSCPKKNRSNTITAVAKSVYYKRLCAWFSVKPLRNIVSCRLCFVSLFLKCSCLFGLARCMSNTEQSSTELHLPSMLSNLLAAVSAIQALADIKIFSRDFHHVIETLDSLSCCWIYPLPSPLHNGDIQGVRHCKLINFIN